MSSVYELGMDIIERQLKSTVRSPSDIYHVLFAEPRGTRDSGSCGGCSHGSGGVA